MMKTDHSEWHWIKVAIHLSKYMWDSEDRFWWQFWWRGWGRRRNIWKKISKWTWLQLHLKLLFYFVLYTGLCKLVKKGNTSSERLENGYKGKTRSVYKKEFGDISKGIKSSPLVLMINGTWTSWTYLNMLRKAMGFLLFSSSLTFSLNTCGWDLSKIRKVRTSLQHFRIFSREVVIQPGSVRIKVRSSKLRSSIHS